MRKFEGLFVPGDYTIARVPKERMAARAKRILGVLLLKTRTRLDESSRTSLTIRDRVILASIVEKEAVRKQQFAEIASVFYNRLAADQSLGSCPTVEYALGYHRPFLLLSDIHIDSPYNVYRRKGLPPTPIAFFSDAAWQAVSKPLKTDFQFFVFDWVTGRLHFSKDYDEHRRNARLARQHFAARFGQARMYEKVTGKFYEY